jgi:hypothetical protein
MCPVWYDEFSLKVGDRLRENIERGLKECKKCIIVLSPNFCNNRGWSKREFDSISIRETLTNQNLILPVWHGVSKEEIFDYCPSLLDVKAVEWNKVEADDVCRQLGQAIQVTDRQSHLSAN